MNVYTAVTHTRWLVVIVPSLSHFWSFLYSPGRNRETKDVVCFHSADFNDVATGLKVDLLEPPMSQVSSFTLIHC